MSAYQALDGLLRSESALLRQAGAEGFGTGPANSLPCNMPKILLDLDAASLSRVIEMAWEDRTPFEAIRIQFLLDEAAVISLMRLQLKPSSFRLWRQRVEGRKTKHSARQRAQLQEARRHDAQDSISLD
jgi:uncharacterized protein (TIGR03643 family)